MKILIPTFTTLELLDPNEIISIQADDNYSLLKMVGGQEITSNQSLGKLLETLSPFGFCQCHKSHLINIAKMKRYHKNGDAEMMNGEMVPVARRRKDDFLEHIETKFQAHFEPLTQNTNR